jgi:hypothetical protein
MWILPNNYQLSSAFAADMVASKEDLTLPGLNIESSLMWRSKPSPSPTWLRRWKPDSWFQRLSSRILKPSQRTSFEAALISSLEATRASRFQQQGSALAPKTQDTSGPTSSTTSMQLDLFDASSRTSKDTSALDLEKSLAIWKAQVTTQRGEYSQRLKSAHRTSGSESTSWLTPRASDTGRGENNETFTNRMGDRSGNVYQSLPSQVHAREAKHNLWPTPRAANPGSRPNGKGGKVLSEEVLISEGLRNRNEKLWPTPSARDWKDSPGMAQTAVNPDGSHRNRNDQLARAVYSVTPPAGSLNPDWVEWLMGVPIGWTDLGSWETE